MKQPQVTVAQGVLEGKENLSENGRVYHNYSGIPYAKPPVGNLRFKPPQKADPWVGVRDATKEGNACRFRDLLHTNFIGDEDCLFVNVYVPQTSSNVPLPVMFNIHGGGFVIGSGGVDMLGPKYLMDLDVILVTCNYRLGILGFLNLDLEDAPGNVGLMDQVAALKWTNENIAAFGGDPNNITISGLSAGAASVHYLMLSDTSKGLFHKAIAQSGCANNPWALQRNHLQRGFQVCEALGHPTTDPKDALEFLKQASVDDLITANIPPVVEGFTVCNFIFVPSIEKRFPGHEPFMPESALAKLKSGNFSKVPLIAGYADAEGKLMFMDIQKDPELFDKFDKDFEKLVPLDLELPLGSEASMKTAKEIRQFYYGDEPVSSNNKEKFVDLISDTWFIKGINDMVKWTAKYSDEPVFYYEYSFTEHGMMSVLIKDIDVGGASHGDDNCFLFTSIYSQSLPKDLPNVVRLQKRLLEIWMNFMKTGNPTPEITELLPVKWEPVTDKCVNYLSIGEDLALRQNPCQKRIEFWDQLTLKTSQL